MVLITQGINPINWIQYLMVHRKMDLDHYQVKALGQQVLTATPKNLQDILPDLRVLLSKSPEELLVELKTSGLRGRGGAGFPMAFKLDGMFEIKRDRESLLYVMQTKGILILFGSILT